MDDGENVPDQGAVKVPKMAVTGDITQIDLPSGMESGLKQALELFGDIEGIKFTYFNQTDVLRHGLVKKILEIYEKSGKD